MARYLDIVYGTSTIHFNYPLRAEIGLRKEYFRDFVLGGARDQAITGLTRYRPEITVEYDLCGFLFKNIALGGDTPQSTIPYVDVRVTIGDENISIENAKVDSWEITWEEGQPARARVTFLGKNKGTSGASSFSVDYSVGVYTLGNCTIKLNGTIMKATRYNIRVNNNIQPLYYGNSLPQELKEQALEIEGRVRLAEFKEVSDGSIQITGSGFTIELPNVKWTEVPPRASGMNVPETEARFIALPGSGGYAIKITYSGDEY